MTTSFLILLTDTVNEPTLNKLKKKQIVRSQLLQFHMLLKNRKSVYSAVKAYTCGEWFRE
jgi:hypothetical protein